MPKRPAVGVHERPHKRFRASPDLLSSLSDELLLRVLSYLSIQELNVCQRVSHRLQEIAGDSQLWKAAYYERFVRPRVLRLPGRKTNNSDPSNLAYSSRLSRWLDEGSLVKRGTSTNWKRQYKLRHNWSRGTCDINQIPVSSQPPTPPLLARLHDGIIYTVDSTAGLRAWSYKIERKILASIELKQFETTRSLPTSFATDMQVLNARQQRLIVGYHNGGFSVYCYDRIQYQFIHLYTHPPSSNGALSAVALSTPYILSMTEAQTLSLYKLDTASDEEDPAHFETPRLLTSLKSHTIWPPVSLALRRNGQNVVASVAYCIPTYNSAWSVGIQELHLTHDGKISSSRLASAVPLGFTLLGATPPNCTASGIEGAAHRIAPSQSPEASIRAAQTFSRPTSLSYSHPYILVSHSDNTLTLYLATSTVSDLSIGRGRRLFGHTSAVFSAHVGVRGKAVSVGTRGNEIRVWELEGATLASSPRSGVAAENLSVQVTPETKSSLLEGFVSPSGPIIVSGSRSGCRSDIDNHEWAVTKGWVGFDDENLIVLREQKHGGQALAVYDFS